MEGDTKNLQENDGNPIFENINMLKFKLFFDTFDQNKRKNIFEIIYNTLFKNNENFKSEGQADIPIDINDYIQTKDVRYNNKQNDIIQLFEENGENANEKLKDFKVKLAIRYKYYLYLEYNENKNKIQISCLRNIRFGNQYEWICHPAYLLYFQYCILKYNKPSRVQSIDENKEEKVESIDSVYKAELLLKNDNFIYIKDSGVQTIDLNAIFEDGNKEYIISKENVSEYLDYNDNDPKQIVDSDFIRLNNYNSIIDFCLESHYDNLIYGFHNGNYFFELNLINCLNSYEKELRFFYLNFKKLDQILNKKHLFKKYLAFWITKLFPDIQQEDSKNNKERNIDNKLKYVEFTNNLINMISINKGNYLQIILDKLNEEFIKNNIFTNKTLVVLNNIDLSYVKWIQDKKFHNLNILFIFNIQDNFDAFQKYYYGSVELKKFFIENKDEILYKEPTGKRLGEDFYSIFKSKDEYEQTKKELVIQIFKDFKNNNDKLLNLAFILNISQLINKINDKKVSLMKLRNELGISTNISILKPFLPLINLYVSVDENSNICNLDDIKFKEIFYYNELKKLYISLMMNYLNANSNELYLSDVKGPLLEKDIILNILTGQIKGDKYNNNLNFKEVDVQSIYCLDYKNENNYENYQDKNIVIIQESKTAEFYDFAFKINNHMKMGQISIFKDDKDLKKLNKEAIILDLIYFDENKGKLNIGEINSYSFAIITSINVFNDYKKSKTEKDKKAHTFFKMKEHCKKYNFEFYVYNYFENNMYIYNENKNEIEKFNNFFGEVNKIDLFDKKFDIYKYMNSSNKKQTIKFTKSNLLYSIENYYQSKKDKKVNIINLAKYEFNSSMLNMFSGIDNIGLAFWNYDTNKKHFDNLKINLNKKTEYFQGKKIIKEKPTFFNNSDNKDIHSLVFLLSEEKVKINKNIKSFLKQKTEQNELYDGDFSELNIGIPKKKKKNKNN